MNEILKSCVPYAQGYWDGRSYGEYLNAYENDNARFMYRLGYDSGVGDYCREIDSEVNDE